MCFGCADVNVLALEYALNGPDDVLYSGHTEASLHIAGDAKGDKAMYLASGLLQPPSQNMNL